MKWNVVCVFLSLLSRRWLARDYLQIRISPFNICTHIINSLITYSDTWNMHVLFFILFLNLWITRNYYFWFSFIFYILTYADLYRVRLLFRSKFVIFFSKVDYIFEIDIIAFNILICRFKSRPSPLFWYLIVDLVIKNLRWIKLKWRGIYLMEIKFSMSLF